MGLTVTNPILDFPVLGEINENSFEILVIDPKTPYQYTFVIQTKAPPEITFFSQIFSLTVKCPDMISFALQGAYQGSMQSFVGATGS
jgi:hypothetical protein